MELAELESFGRCPTWAAPDARTNVPTKTADTPTDDAPAAGARRLAACKGENIIFPAVVIPKVEAPAKVADPVKKPDSTPAVDPNASTDAPANNDADNSNDKPADSSDAPADANAPAAGTRRLQDVTHPAPVASNEQKEDKTKAPYESFMQCFNHW